MEQKVLKGVFIDSEHGAARIEETQDLSKLLKSAIWVPKDKQEFLSKHILIQGLNEPITILSAKDSAYNKYPKPSSILEDEKGYKQEPFTHDDIFIVGLQDDKLVSLTDKQIQKVMERMTVFENQICLSVKEKIY